MDIENHKLKNEISKLKHEIAMMRLELISDSIDRSFNEQLKIRLELGMANG